MVVVVVVERLLLLLLHCWPFRRTVVVTIVVRTEGTFDFDTVAKKRAQNKKDLDLH